ncbi:MAG: hypothetical protein RID09_00250 [Coleofasciculus sp. G1-WW12-02]|uniref:hypothetical protein n=1 Tax=Coleofasciculus sp. G1-WW12-02 TaxID=3068483 RepID=UPI003300E07C
MTTTDELKSRPLPPGHFGLPLIGETIQFFRDPDFAKKRHQKYGSIFRGRFRLRNAYGHKV